MRVLVVDDEPRFRSYVSKVLETWGHNIRTAATGAGAIEEGLGFRPDVLVTDFMLRHPIHGLHVAGALTCIDPRLQTILITGFDSAELRHDARDGCVLRFLAKPFELSELEAALRDAVAQRNRQVAVVPFGVVRVDAGGRILHLNDKAWDMFAESHAGRSAQNVDELFDTPVVQRVVTADGRWFAAALHAPIPRVWWMHCRPTGTDILCLLLPEEEQILQSDTRVRLLTGDHEPDPAVWPFEDQVLILDADPAVARLHAAQLEVLGCTAYKADHAELALRLLDANPRIRVVVFDRELRDQDPKQLVDRIRRARPEVKLVGNDRAGNPSDFRALEVTRFLAKPWRVTDLIRVLQSDS